MASRQERNNANKVTEPVMDFTVGEARYRYYALNKGQYMQCPTKANLTFNGPSLVWYKQSQHGEDCVEYDVNDPRFWNMVASAIEWRDDVTMHHPPDPNRRNKQPAKD
jgi:hypothetical protein